MTSALFDPGTAAPANRGEVVVRVPGSTSNLGAGFDCVGMAVDRWLEARVGATSRDDGVRITRSGTLAAVTCDPEDDLIWRGFVAACVALRVRPPASMSFEVTSNIPVARGLGSSAAAVVAGVTLANSLLHGELDSAALIDIAASLEGHPDNVAPATLGGAVLSVRTTGHHYACVPLAVHPSLRFVFLVPDFEVRTSAARAALPVELPFDTAVTAISRSAALVAGLGSGDRELLETALDDLVHVPWRRSLVAGYDHVTNAAIAAGAFGATLSGSGSTIVAVCVAEGAGEVRDAALRAWRLAGFNAEGFVTSAELRGAVVSASPGK